MSISKTEVSWSPDGRKLQEKNLQVVGESLKEVAKEFDKRWDK